MNTSEITIKGRSASPGIAIGKAVVIDSKSKTVHPTTIKKNEVALHKNRFNEARRVLVDELSAMTGELEDADTSQIIDSQKQIIEDPEVEKNVFDIVENKLLSVDFAVYQTYCSFIERLKESGSELFRQRIIDLQDIRDRFVNQVCDQEQRSPIKKGSVIVTNEISPTDLVSYYEDGAAGLIMEKGGITSHAAIIAKSLGIPCIVNAEKVVKESISGEQIILDALDGTVLLRPSSKSLSSYRKKLEAFEEANQPKECGELETNDGIPFKLLANIEFEAEVSKVGQSNARGIGLLRTEGLLFGKQMRDSKEEQETFYEQILSGTTGPVTIRLFDIGGDKNERRPYKEKNPFLGWRGIRLLLDQKKLLRSQLQAILTVAGKYPGRVKILVPMVSVIEEVHQIRNEIETAQEALVSAGVPVDEDIPIGLMVEVPSVALQAFDFAKEVDFLSVGSNDLTQYTLAVDRGNEKISNLFQHYHPSVLKLIKMTFEGARKADVEISVCGELAGDKIGAACLFGMGINELSMVPGSIPAIGNLLSSRSYNDFKKLAASALECASADEVERVYDKWKDGG